MVPDVTEEMWELYNQGVSLRDVGDRYGFSAEGVRIRLIKAGYPRRTNFETQILKQFEPIESFVKALELWHTTFDDTKTIAQKLDISANQFEKYVKANTTRGQRLDHGRNLLSRVDRNWYTDEEMLDAIRACVEYHHGKVPGRILYNQFASERYLPTAQTISNRFVSWSDAITAAGFAPHARPEGTGLPVYSIDDFESALRRVAEIVGRRPSMADYTQHRRSSDPKMGTFRQRFGGWINALDILL